MGAARYRCEFESFAGLNWSVTIWDRDLASGSPNTFCLGPEGFELTYDGDTDDIFKPVIPSRLEFKFNVEDSTGEDFIFDVASGDPDRFRVYVTNGTGSAYDTNLYWQGFIQGEGITIDDAAMPYEVGLAATDIAFFDQIDMADASGEPITGSQTMTEWMLGGVLDFSGHRNFVNESVHTYSGSFLKHNINWRANDMASSGDPFNLSRVDGHTWYKYDKANAIDFKNCLDVGGEIAKFYGCRFFQSDGAFWLQQIDDLVESTSTVYTYDYTKSLAGTATGQDLSVDIDRSSLYELGGGSTSFQPGIKRAEKRLNFRRNYLEGKSADQDNALNYEWTPAIPILDGYENNVQAPQFTLKFRINYKLTSKPQYDDAGTGDMKARSADLPVGIIPCWRLTFAGTGGTDSLLWYYVTRRTIGTELPIIEYIESEGPTNYKKALSRAGDLSNWEFSKKWVDAPAAGDEFFEIFAKEEYTWPNGLTDNPDQPEGGMDVELNIPYFANGSTYNNTNFSTVIQGLVDGTITLDLYGYYNRWYTEWRTVSPETELEWNVEQMELYVHGDTFEKELLSKYNFRVSNDTSNREKVEMDSCDLVAIDKRTWHTVEVWDGSEYVNSPLWYRGVYTGIGDLILMNYLPAREAIGHQYRGLRLYQGGLVSVDTSVRPGFHNTITKGSIKYMPVQGTYVAKYDEWRNITLAELTRDISDLTFEQIQEEGSEGSGYSTSGGGSSGGGSNGGGTTESYGIPNYERATGQTGSSYTVTGFSVSGASGYSDDEINQSLHVFQDSTKLSHGIGYTLSGQDLTFTYDLDSSVIEIYSWL